MPRNLGRFAPVNVLNIGSKLPIILDPYSLFAATPIAAIGLIYYGTFNASNPGVALAANIGLGIGLTGMVLGLFMFLFTGKLVGRVVFVSGRMPFTFYAQTGATIGVLSLISIGLQVLLLASGHAQSGLAPTLTIWDSLYFVESMAIMETWFFSFFLYPLMRAAWKNWVIANIITAAIAAYIYHQNVYKGDLYFETAAFIGFFVYSTAVQLTGRISVSMGLHGLQQVAAIRNLMG